MSRARSRLAGLLIFVAAGQGAGAQQVPANPAQELIRLEQARQTLEQALDDLFGEGKLSNRTARQEAMIDTAHELLSAGPDIVPALIDELEQARQTNFHFIAYTLGLFGTPEARQALRTALARADDENGRFAEFRKRWAAYGLGLAREAEAIKLANSGRHLTGHFSIHANVSTIGAIALQTVPECVPVLLSELDHFAGSKDEHQRLQRHAIVRTLGRVGDPRAVPALLKVLAEEPPDQYLRFKAVLALARIGTPEATAAVLAALGDDEDQIRSAAAVELGRLLPAGALPTLMRRIEEETDPGIRGRLYRAVAGLGGSATLETLARFQDRSDWWERLHMVTAVATMRDPKGLGILRAALSDPVNDVAMEAIRGLARIDAAEATALMTGQVDSPAWPRAATALSELIRADRTGSAEAIARRLLDVELASVVRAPEHRARIEELLGALVALGYYPALEKLRHSTDRQSDTALLGTIADAVAQLELLQGNGDNVESWITTLDAPDKKHRRLAYRRLGQLGGKQAARALVSRFGRVELDEGVEILSALGRVDRPPSRELIRRVLVSPEFDAFELQLLRDTAAWSARRLGGPDMFASLQESARRRSGRDARVLIYAAILGREAALPLLDELRVPRLRYLTWLRGNEMDRLDWIARRISQGRDLHDYDLPPDQLDFR